MGAGLGLQTQWERQGSGKGCISSPLCFDSMAVTCGSTSSRNVLENNTKTRNKQSDIPKSAENCSRQVFPSFRILNLFFIVCCIPFKLEFINITETTEIFWMPQRRRSPFLQLYFWNLNLEGAPGHSFRLGPEYSLIMAMCYGCLVFTVGKKKVIN